MGPLQFFTDFLSEPLPRLTFIPGRCLRSRLNTNECQRCLEKCPSGALNIHNRKINLDTTRCTGCMSCVAVCPQDGLVSDHDLGELLHFFQAGGDVVVSCSRQAQSHPDEVTIPCVGILSKQVLIAIILSGCRSVTFHLTGCAGCPNRDVANGFIVDCRQVIDDFSDVDTTKLILAEKREQTSSQQINRRAYLTKIRNIAAAVSKRNLTQKPTSPADKIPNSRRIPFKTQLVKELHSTVRGNSQKKILSLLGHNLSTNEHCDCCPLCKGICPTGAIQIDRSGQERSLRFEMLDCSGCRLCVEFCKKNALLLERW